MGILLSSHQLPARAQPDRYLVMEEGAIIAQGDPAALRRTLGVTTLSLDSVLRAALHAHEAGAVDA